MGLVVCILVISAAAASANVPSLTLSTATTAAAGTQAVLFNLPSGEGAAFDEAVAPPPVAGTQGAIIDATVTLTLRDGNGDPIANFPGEDLWLDTTSTDFYACNNGTIADFNTDASGVTTWEFPLLAGGYTDPTTDVTQVYVNGAPLSGAGMDLQFNSADMFPDGVVDASDVAEFAGAYFGAGYVFAGDLFYDGVVDASDVAQFAGGFGTECPGDVGK